MWCTRLIVVIMCNMFPCCICSWPFSSSVSFDNDIVVWMKTCKKIYWSQTETADTLSLTLKRLRKKLYLYLSFIVSNFQSLLLSLSVSFSYSLSFLPDSLYLSLSLRASLTQSLCLSNTVFTLYLLTQFYLCQGLAQHRFSSVWTWAMPYWSILGWHTWKKHAAWHSTPNRPFHVKR